MMSSALGVGADGDARPRREGELTALIRPEPSAEAVRLRTDLELSVLSAFGIPLGLVRPDAANIDLRESQRQLLNGVLKPIAASISTELTLKMDKAVTVSVDIKAGADLATRARALKALVESGLALDDARKVVGL